MIEDGDAYITSTDRRQVGFISAVFLTFNRMVGTGIFATPSEILSLSGSVGLALFMWVAGMIIAFAGMAVYMEFGTAIPRNGGEKNYLEYVYRKPRFLATAMYAAYVVLLGWAGSNSVIFGEYILNAAQVEVNRWNQRGIGLACITVAFLIHGLALNWGLRLQNFLGIVKLLILLLIVICGFVSSLYRVKVIKADTVRSLWEAISVSTNQTTLAMHLKAPLVARKLFHSLLPYLNMLSFIDTELSQLYTTLSGATLATVTPIMLCQK